MAHLDDVIGQEHAKRVLQMWVDRSLVDKTPMPHVLLTGPPGMGKTLFTHAVAGELELDEEDVLELDLARMNATRLFQALLRFPYGLIVLDEVHEARRPQQDLLLQAMAENILTLAHGGRYELGDISFIAATTHPELLDPAFASRFSVHVEVEPYSEAEMAVICQQVAATLGGALTDRDALALARASLGVPRTAKDLVRTWWALRPEGTVGEALELLRVEEDGLSAQHVRYLTVMRDLGGQLGQRSLSNVLRMHPTVLAEVERTLIDKGLLTLTPAGRMLTAAAYRRLGGNRAQNAHSHARS
jgi:holliday junction DNA helicase RuvB